MLKKYGVEFSEIMKKSKEKHNNFILPENIPMYFCELQDLDQESKNEIRNIINFLKEKEQMFKSISTRKEKAK